MFESDDLKYHKGKRYGLFRAFVADNKDPQHQGRLKLQIPSVYGIDDDSGEPCVTDWAYPMFPIAGSGWGINLVPPVFNPDGSRTMVWVEFEQGDIEKPVWMGCPIQQNSLQSDAASNSVDKKAGVTSKSVFSFSTPGGLKIVLDDQNKEKAITISSKSLQIVFNDKAKKIIVSGDVDISGLETVSKDVVSKVSLNKHTHTGVNGETSGPH